MPRLQSIPRVEYSSPPPNGSSLKTIDSLAMLTLSIIFNELPFIRGELLNNLQQEHYVPTADLFSTPEKGGEQIPT